MKITELKYNNDDICIIGMSGEFPGSPDLAAYWKNLAENNDCITRDRSFDKENYVGAYGRIDDAYMFDNEFFGITAFDAVRMDPQQRKLFEQVYSALESAGYSDRKKDKSVTGLLSVVHSTHYIWEDCYAGDTYSNEKISMLGLYSGSAVSTRIAYSMNLTGPVLTFDDACASSLVGIDIAAVLLKKGECNKCIVASASIFPDQNGYYRAENADSSDGYVRAYDRNGTGFVPGSAAAAIVLKKYSDAQRDGDMILGVIKGSFVTNDGNRKIGFAAPGVMGEYEAISGAAEAAGMTAEDIGYIEGHGTATPLGDSVEIAALKKFFRGRTEGKCAIGSVKSQIGHTDCVSGLAGILKVVLSMKNGIIPASINCDEVNEDITEKSKIYVAVKNEKWNTDKAMIAGVSSFGMGGINAHVIIQEPPRPSEVSGSDRDMLIPLSAETPEAAERCADDCVEYFSYFKDNIKGCVKAELRKPQMPYRTFVRIDMEGKVKKEPSAERCFPENERTVVFMFPGGGSQMKNMGRELYQKNRYFKETINNYCKVLNECEKIDLYSYFESGEEVTGITAGLCLIFMISCATAELLIKAGTAPDYLLGNSLGEYAAAYISGIVSLEGAFRMIAARGRLIETTEDGAMLSICAQRSKVEELIIGTGAEISSVNSVDRICVSGNAEEIKIVEKKAAENGLISVYLNVGKAGHCALVEPIADEFYEAVKNIEMHEAKIPVLSSRLGKLAESNEMSTPSFWKNHLRYSVEFSDAAESIRDRKNIIFIECGTGKQLASFVRRIYSDRADKFVISLIEEEVFPEYRQFIISVGRIWQAGIDIDRSITDDTDYELAEANYLPTYHFIGKEFRHKIDRGKRSKNKIAVLSDMSDESAARADVLLSEYPEGPVIAGSTDILHRSAFDTDYVPEKDSEMIKGYKDKYFSRDDVVILSELPDFSEDANRISAACVLDYFRKNAPGYHSEVWTKERIVSEFGVVAEYAPFIEYLTAFLTDHGYARNNYGMLGFTEKCINIPEKYTLLEEMKEKYPDKFAYMEFCCVISDTWNDVFRGKKKGNSILYPSGSFDLITSYDKRMPVTSYQDHCIEALGEYINGLKSSLGREVRIIEIGGGTGELTDILLNKLGSEGFTYTFTDIGASFVAARKNSDNGRPYMRYGVLDISRSPEQQGFSSKSYDIAVCLNVVQATEDIHGSVGNISALLTDGGIFGMVETCTGLELINMIFGYAPGWWNYINDPCRDRITVSPEKWQEYLLNSGFDKAMFFPESRSSDTYVFIAGKERLNSERKFSSDEAERNYELLKEKYPDAVFDFTAAEPIERIIKEKYPDHALRGFGEENGENGKTHVTDCRDEEERSVYRLINEIIGADNVRRSDRLTDIGFDSLSGLILIARLKEVLGKELTVSELTECETVSDLFDKLKSISDIEQTSGSVEKVKKAEHNIDDLLEEL